MPASLDAAVLTVMAARAQLMAPRSTVRRPSTTPSVQTPPARKASSHRLRAMLTYCSCLISKPATCWPSLIYFAGASAAGIVLGARMPIVLTSRTDPLTARIASAALAKPVAAPHPLAGLP